MPVWPGPHNAQNVSDFQKSGGRSMPSKDPPRDSGRFRKLLAGTIITPRTGSGDLQIEALVDTPRSDVACRQQRHRGPRATSPTLEFASEIGGENPVLRSLTWPSGRAARPTKPASRSSPRNVPRHRTPAPDRCVRHAPGAHGRCRATAAPARRFGRSARPREARLSIAVRHWG